MSKVMQDLQRILQRELALLQALHFDALVELPCYQTSEEVLDGKTIEINKYHEVLGGEVHRIVVQVIRRSFGGMTATVLANGFDVDLFNNVRALDERDLYDFT
jgi:hypothetical protein